MRACGEGGGGGGGGLRNQLAGLQAGSMDLSSDCRTAVMNLPASSLQIRPNLMSPSRLRMKTLR